MAAHETAEVADAALFDSDIAVHDVSINLSADTAADVDSRDGTTRGESGDPRSSRLGDDDLAPEVEGTTAANGADAAADDPFSDPVAASTMSKILDRPVVMRLREVAPDAGVSSPIPSLMTEMGRTESTPTPARRKTGAPDVARAEARADAERAAPGSATPRGGGGRKTPPAAPATAVSKDEQHARIATSPQSSAGAEYPGDAPIATANGGGGGGGGSNDVGRKIAVLWKSERRYFAGTVAAYDSINGKHHVKYSDGDDEWIAVAKHDVKWDADADAEANKTAAPMDEDDADTESERGRVVASRAAAAAALKKGKKAPAPAPTRRARGAKCKVVLSDSDYDVDADGGGEDGEDGASEESESEFEVESEESEEEESEEESPKLKVKGGGAKAKPPPAKKATPKKAAAAAAATPLVTGGGGKSLASAMSEPQPAPPTGSPALNPAHYKARDRLMFPWLQLDGRKDASGHVLSDPEYDPTTLRLPASFSKCKDIVARPVLRTPGLENRGNTCYVNSTLQVLCGLDEFARAVEAKPLADGGFDDRSVYSAVRRLVAARRESHEPVLSSEGVKTAVQRRHLQYVGNQQHDAHEFLRDFLHTLEEEVTAAYHKIVPLHRTLCPTRTNFTTEVVRTSTCEECGAKCVRNETFQDISVAFPESSGNGRHVELASLLRGFFTPETVEKNCEKDGCNCTSATHVRRIVRLPRVLVVHLNRFSFDKTNLEQFKVTRRVNLPTKLTLEPFVVEDSSDLRGPPPWSNHAVAAEVTRSVDSAPADATEGARGSSNKKRKAPTTKQIPAEERPTRRSCRIATKDVEHAGLGDDHEETETEIETTPQPRGVHDEATAAVHVYPDDTSPSGEDAKRQAGAYELRGVITHLGESPKSGHYVAHVRGPNRYGGVGWTTFDDGVVDEVTEAKVLSDRTGCYVAVYALGNLADAHADATHLKAVSQGDAIDVDSDVDSPDPVVLERALNDMLNEEFMDYNSARTGGPSEEEESVDSDVDSPDPVVLERALNDMLNEEFLDYNSARTGGPVEDSTGKNYSPFFTCDGKKVDAYLKELDDFAGRPNAILIRDHLRKKAKKQGHPNLLPGEPPLDASRGAIVYLPGELPFFYNYSGWDSVDRLPTEEFTCCKHAFWLHAAPSTVAGKTKVGDHYKWCLTFERMFDVVEILASNRPPDMMSKPLVVLWMDLFPSTDYFVPVPWNPVEPPVGSVRIVAEAAGVDDDGVEGDDYDDDDDDDDDDDVEAGPGRGPGPGLGRGDDDEGGGGPGPGRGRGRGRGGGGGGRGRGDDDEGAGGGGRGRGGGGGGRGRGDDDEGAGGGGRGRGRGGGGRGRGDDDEGAGGGGRGRGRGGGGRGRGDDEGAGGGGRGRGRGGGGRGRGDDEGAGGGGRGRGPGRGRGRGGGGRGRGDDEGAGGGGRGRGPGRGRGRGGGGRGRGRWIWDGQRWVREPTYMHNPRQNRRLGHINRAVARRVALDMMGTSLEISVRHGFELNLCSGKMFYFLEELMKERGIKSAPEGFGRNFPHPSHPFDFDPDEYAKAVLGRSGGEGGKLIGYWRVRARKRALSWWYDPEFGQARRDEASQRALSWWNDPEFGEARRDEASQRTLSWWYDPEFGQARRDEASQRALSWWNDPEFGEARRDEASQRTLSWWYDPTFGEARRDEASRRKLVWWYDPEFLDAALKRLRKAFVEDRGCQPKDDADLVAWRKARGCFNCEKTESKWWRTGPDGPSTLCTTCGQFFNKNGKLPDAQKMMMKARQAKQDQGKPKATDEVVDDQGVESIRGCFNCEKKTESKRWRTGPDGPSTLCDTCGTYFSKHRKLPDAQKMMMKARQAKQDQGKPKATDEVVDDQGVESIRGCFNCENTESKWWRTGPDGPSTLCTTCGQFFDKNGKLPDAQKMMMKARQAKQDQGKPKATDEVVDDQGVESIRGCFNCEKTESKRWRTGPDGPSTLCDTCGTYFSKHKKHRPEHIFLKDKWRVRADQSAG